MLTIMRNTEAKFQYEAYNPADYEERKMPQFELNEADFPPVVGNRKNKVTSVTWAGKNADMSVSYAAKVSSANASANVAVTTSKAAVDTTAQTQAVTTTSVIEKSGATQGTLAPAGTMTTGIAASEPIELDMDLTDLALILFGDDNEGDLHPTDLQPIDLLLSQTEQAAEGVADKTVSAQQDVSAQEASATSGASISATMME